MKKSLIVASIACAVAFGLTNARADERAWAWSPIGVGIAAPIQLPFMSSDIYGIRFGGFLGINNDVFGLDAGVVEISAGHFAGVQGSAFSWTEGSVCGIQAAGLANVVGGNLVAIEAAPVNVIWGAACGIQAGVVDYNVAFAGVQAAALNWDSDASCGLQAAIANVDPDSFAGLAVGVVDFARDFEGAQIGAFNLADNITGCQIGVINACDRMRGVQIGLINLITTSKLPIMIVANASF